MKCPKCGFVSADYYDSCQNCHREMSDVRALLNLTHAVQPVVLNIPYEGETGEYLGEGDEGAQEITGREGEELPGVESFGGDQEELSAFEEGKAELDLGEPLEEELGNVDLGAAIGEGESELEASAEQGLDLGMDEEGLGLGEAFPNLEEGASSEEGLDLETGEGELDQAGATPEEGLDLGDETLDETLSLHEPSRAGPALAHEAPREGEPDSLEGVDFADILSEHEESASEVQEEDLEIAGNIDLSDLIVEAESTTAGAPIPEEPGEGFPDDTSLDLELDWGELKAEGSEAREAVELEEEPEETAAEEEAPGSEDFDFDIDLDFDTEKE